MHKIETVSHFLFLFYIITIILGSMLLSLNYILLKKEKESIFKIAFIFNIFFYLLVVVYIFDFYRDYIMLNRHISRILDFSIDISLACFYISLLFLLHELLKVRIKKYILNFFIGYFTFYIILWQYLLDLILRVNSSMLLKKTLYFSLELPLALIFPAYFFILYIKNRDKIKEKALILYSKMIFELSIAIVIFGVIDILTNFKYSIHPLNILYVFYSVISLYFAVKYIILRTDEEFNKLYLKLTEREITMVAFVKKGLSNKEIANKLFISEHTVKKHLYNIYKKLNVKNRVELILKDENI